MVLITALQQLCEAPSSEEGGAFLVIAGNLLKWLYDSDVVGEEAVLAWAGTGEGGGGEVLAWVGTAEGCVWTMEGRGEGAGQGWGEGLQPTAISPFSSPLSAPYSLPLPSSPLPTAKTTILKSTLSPFRTAVKPFVEWLQEAEESGEEEDDE